MTAVETLRKAAEALRSLAEDATAGPWSQSSQYGRVDVFQHPYNPGDDMVAEKVDASDAEYIAAMSPVVGLALAGWLEATAREFEALQSDPLKRSGAPLDGRRAGALAVARAVLGES